MTALVGSAVNLLLSAIEFGIARELALASLNDIATAKPTASNDATRGLEGV